MNKIVCPNCNYDAEQNKYEVINIMTDKIVESTRKGIPDFNKVIKIAICPSCHILFVPDLEYDDYE